MRRCSSGFGLRSNHHISGLGKINSDFAILELAATVATDEGSTAAANIGSSPVTHPGDVSNPGRLK